ncbi:hypothetical protein Ait01nite_091160 [Actinoplanes italicus]|nr:hypothetical protein Ait01nite_091160 [Actinoplanes italicus]
MPMRVPWFTPATGKEACRCGRQRRWDLETERQDGPDVSITASSLSWMII